MEPSPSIHKAPSLTPSTTIINKGQVKLELCQPCMVTQAYNPTWEAEAEESWVVYCQSKIQSQKKKKKGGEREETSEA